MPKVRHLHAEAILVRGPHLDALGPYEMWAAGRLNYRLDGVLITPAGLLRSDVLVSAV